MPGFFLHKKEPGLESPASSEKFEIQNTIGNGLQATEPDIRNRSASGKTQYTTHDSTIKSGSGVVDVSNSIESLSLDPGPQ